ncbi:MAG: lysine-2,3-aminomutase-like protein, partial [Aestuariivirga sp.]
ELSDPIGDQTHSPVKGIVHRYSDRLLLTPTHTCAVYCRFCFRREKVGKADAALNKSEMDAALDYISAHPKVSEVILSGGDPLVLSDRRISEIMQRLAAIAHVQVIRIHTRVPVVEPARITPALLKILRVRPAVYMVLHVNHVAELSAPVKKTIARMARAGIPLLSQSVLLKGVNDSSEVLEDLFRTLVANRVKPYYLHQLDKAQGTSHFRVSIKRGQDLMRSLRGRLSGIAQPTYVVDIPGGHGKVPIGPTYLTENEIADPQGRRHQYFDK